MSKRILEILGVYILHRTVENSL